MPTPDARLERRISDFGTAVREALGSRLVCCALAGSAVADDWVAGRSDVNTIIVAEPLDATVLESLGPVVRGFTAHRFAVPLLVDPEFLARARDVFPMELDDIRRQHRILEGRDVLTDLVVERGALRRQCEHEARSRLLRLRALCLLTEAAGANLEPPLLDSVKSVLVLLRHLVRLHGDACGPRYTDALRTAEGWLGPLPVLRRLLAHREATAPMDARALAAGLPGYLAEGERIVRALDALEA